MSKRKHTKKELEALRAKRHAARESATNYQNDNQVMTVPQWCALNNFNVPTGKRVLASGNGPKVLQLTARRLGIRVGDNRAWQEARARS